MLLGERGPVETKVGQITVWEGSLPSSFSSESSATITGLTVSVPVRRTGEKPHSEHRFPALPPNSARTGYTVLQMMLNVLGCRLTYQEQAETSALARFNTTLRPRKPEGSLGRTAQDGHLDSHTATEL